MSIVDYICAPESSLGIAGHLRSMIAEHHSNFKQLYPHRPLTPKFHYMIHMPLWIVRYVSYNVFAAHIILMMFRHGPLIRMWCMRYEAKHRYFKRWSNIMGNFKNIAKTLAMHHQKYICYHLLKSENSSFLSSPPLVGPGKFTLSHVAISNSPSSQAM